MPVLPEVLKHLAHANVVRGGGLLFSDRVSPLLMPVEAPRGVRRGTWTSRGSMSIGRRAYPSRTTWGESAEAIRAMKASMGVPARPVEA